MAKDTIYNSALYYDDMICETGTYDQVEYLFNAFAQWIVKCYNPKTVLDVGCAVGYLVAALRDLGVEAYGVDISEYAVSQVRDDVRPYCHAGDFVQGLPDSFPEKFDVVTNIEVAEHLYSEDLPLYMDMLCRKSDRIIFSSSPDATTDITHYNVQQPEYWAKQFFNHGFLRNHLLDVEFLTPWGFVFERTEKEPMRLVEDYERSLRHLRRKYLELVKVQREQESVPEPKGNTERDFAGEQARMQQEIDALRQQNQSLEQQNRELAAAYHDVTSSTSWKVTKPVRGVGRIFK